MKTWRDQIQLWVAVIALSVTAVSVMGGCHRQYYRQQADMEAHQLIDQNAHRVARSPSAAIRVEVDRQSRMFNPFDVDFQPMPIDDPASYQYMQCVDGRRGYPMWEAAGFTNTAESPDWWQFLPLDEDGVLTLDLDGAVQIALLHSPGYQRQIENLYLSALAVSAQRFEFDTQFFGGASTALTADGPRRTNGNSSTRFDIGPNSNGRRDFSLERKFAAGGDLIVGIANSIVWELSGPNTQSATTVLDFAFAQPLLRAAGRDIVMEDLTAAERNLLANVRSFERFRRGFYLNVTIGRGLESQVSSNSNASSDSVANATGGGNVGGYLGLLQSQLRIRNQQENISRQTENVLILEDSLIELLTTIPDDAGSILRQQLQVAQARQSVFSSQSSLVDQQASFERSVDSFLRTLGLPPYLCLRLNDPILNRFELIEQNLLSRREQLSALRTKVGALNVTVLKDAEFKIDEETGLPVSTIVWSDELAEALKLLQKELEPLGQFNESLIDEDLPSIAIDINGFEESLPERMSQTADLKQIYEDEKDGICGLLNISELDESIFTLDELADLSEALKESFSKLEDRFLGYEARISKLNTALEEFIAKGGQGYGDKEFSETLRDDIILATQDLLSELGDDVLSLQLIQARARTESLLLPEVDIDPQSAFFVARKNRRDYANAKAAVVDQWRQIEVAADDLESSLDVVFSGDVGNDGNNPLKLRSTTGRLRVGLQWDAPITRLLERNAYRTSLIEYERTKRNFYQFEDSLWQLLRSEVRQLRANRLNFELGRQSIRIAASQIELNADIRASNDARGQGAGPTAARDAISALNDLLNAQNSLLGVFVGYEVVRRGLDFDMGTMEITEEGLWIDPGTINPDNLIGLPGTEAAMLQVACNECCLSGKAPPTTPIYLDPNTFSRGRGGDGLKLSDKPASLNDPGSAMEEDSQLSEPLETQLLESILRDPENEAGMLGEDDLILDSATGEGDLLELDAP